MARAGGANGIDNDIEVCSDCGNAENILHGHDYEGADLVKGGVTSSSPSDCCSLCRARDGCSYWAYGNSGARKGTCWLKRSRSGRQLQANRDAGSVCRTSRAPPSRRQELTPRPRATPALRAPVEPRHRAPRGLPATDRDLRTTTPQNSMSTTAQDSAAETNRDIRSTTERDVQQTRGGDSIGGAGFSEARRGRQVKFRSGVDRPQELPRDDDAEEGREALGCSARPEGVDDDQVAPHRPSPNRAMLNAGAYTHFEPSVRRGVVDGSVAGPSPDTVSVHMFVHMSTTRDA